MEGELIIGKKEEKQKGNKYLRKRKENEDIAGLKDGKKGEN